MKITDTAIIILGIGIIIVTLLISVVFILLLVEMGAYYAAGAIIIISLIIVIRAVYSYLSYRKEHKLVNQSNIITKQI
ncbi:MAG: hypothetical protein BWK75_03250 [Candidatus Altiarchaeales archaeon A3]|nr:MAG: hypothetical protein BWK75_03250 [Candidatus Altiarchaeales archaeon A3]